eukprot:CAMPEP_0203899106 /NCGR_PEP_ID=MMETSP0359-20131031/41564_1 /ASSEMBLY_ACC=CAM_ASM_000338 /TAXON_ID=268821 /ORGANISM="Scrippsiella Hangoei, Strain SHTV-5" /LENGTH=58 /DNA_ID=CAMNT_0050822299 /DNA_START=431 /DNA_END=605 /DNA_ORIENTATION=-
MTQASSIEQLNGSHGREVQKQCSIKRLKISLEVSSLVLSKALLERKSNFGGPTIECAI